MRRSGHTNAAQHCSMIVVRCGVLIGSLPYLQHSSRSTALAPKHPAQSIGSEPAFPVKVSRARTASTVDWEKLTKPLTLERARIHMDGLKATHLLQPQTLMQIIPL